ncbi:MAG: hypothetical protein KA479_08800 [Saprospiraceae bacterium]|nr:hypothetical protein [Saprospiraceae bacterium]
MSMPATGEPQVRIFGIRHHGPGSALRMLDQIKTYSPDLLLVECPADAQPALVFLSNPALIPPVAILLYRPDDYTLAAHLPFARFSPEWQALRYADAHHIPAVAMDLPWGVSVQATESESREEEMDPFMVIARTMGYDDTERWWEYFFEQVHNDEDLFPSITALMAAFRDHSTYGNSVENQRREAWMRQTIRKEAAKGYTRIAIVCGAFHAPALVGWAATQVQDAKTLQSINAAQVQATWVPWTYGHLANRSGYGAGVLSPAWYELLYDYKANATLQWVARCAWFLRQKGVPVPPASLPAAIEMAQSLAALRGMLQPGMSELEEAAIAVFVQGDPQWLLSIREELLIGDKMGKVPIEVPRTPLQEDFHQAIKAARLKRSYETPGRIQLDLDLRIASNRLASPILHRLNLLGIPWGKLLALGDRTKGSFKERWRLEWKPLFDLRLLECGVWGLTIEEAASRYVLHLGKGSPSLATLAALLRDTLMARLQESAGLLASQLKEHAALATDIWDMATSLTPLVQIHRYGHGYETPTIDLRHLLEQLVPRLVIGLPRALEGLSEEQVKQTPDRMRQLLTDIQAMGVKDWTDAYWQQMIPLLDDNKLSPYIHGGLCRLCWEEKQMDAITLQRLVRERMSVSEDPANTASWVAGLLTGAESILLRQKAIWVALDQWVTGINALTFRTLLPILRKVFTGFSPQARRQIAALLKRQEMPIQEIESSEDSVPAMALSEAQEQILLPGILAFLGLKRT